MTDTPRHPSPSRPAQARRTIRITPPDGWARAGLAGIEAALIGWALVMVLALVGYSGVSSNPWLGKATWSDAMDIGGDIWASVLGASVTAGGVSYRAIPTLVAVLVVLMLRALMIPGRRYSGRAQWTAVPTFAVTSLALIAATSAHVSVMGSLLGAILVPAVAAAWASTARRKDSDAGGSSPESTRSAADSEEAEPPSRLSAWAAQVPWLWDGLRQARACVVLVVVASLVAVIVSVICSWDAIRNIDSLLQAGRTDTWVIGIAQILFLPSAMAWALSWLAGPGFLVGTDTVHSPTSAPVAPIPAIPALGAVPTTAPGNVVVLILIALGVAAGAWIVWRHRADSLRVQAIEALVSLVAILVFVAAWSWVSTLSLGAGRMSVLGPRLLPTSVFVMLEVGAVAEFVALVSHSRSLTLFRSGAGVVVASGHEAAGKLSEAREKALSKARKAGGGVDASGEGAGAVVPAVHRGVVGDGGSSGRATETAAPSTPGADKDGSGTAEPSTPGIAKAGTVHVGGDEPTERIDLSEAPSAVPSGTSRASGIEPGTGAPTDGDADAGRRADVPPEPEPGVTTGPRSDAASIAESESDSESDSDSDSESVSDDDPDTSPSKEVP